MPTKKIVKAESVTEEAKKPAAKKTATKAKKATTAKKAKKEVKPLKTVQEYKDIINWKKGEAHALDWLYIEVNAGDLLNEVESGADNLDAVCNAILDCLLIGDCIIADPGSSQNHVGFELTVRYYCDNLDPSRDKYHF